mmetsp:Transcript_3873/g.8308  ORF Transcript_3873/g.8308 Transcript_3873/m.8308 type:complete len:495 (-) Transcript_3873:846-2330(-)
MTSFLLLALLALSPATIFAIDNDAEWRTYVHHLSNIQVRNQKMPNLLGRLLDYKFSLPEVQLRRGTVYLGSNHRLRAALARALSGKPVRIGVVGGSISYGHGATQKGRTDWVSVFQKYLATAFRNVTLRNGCIPGTPSAYMVVCLDMSVDPDVDVVFSEYILNDGRHDSISNNPKTREYERLVRRVLGLPSRPAMVMMQVYSHGNAFPNTHHEWKPFHDGIEDVYGSLAQYYDVQWLSFRGATYRLSSFKADPNFTWNRLMDIDFTHPNDLGHKIMADLAVWLVQQTAMDLLLRPPGHSDSMQLTEALPEPMYPGNIVPSSTMCVHYDALQQLMQNSRGFEFIAEGAKRKKGYVGLTPGNSITFKVDTNRGGTPDMRVTMQVGHLKSYEHMGKAKVECVSGCTCNAPVLDGHCVERNSQLHLFNFYVSQAAECIIAITVLPETTSGEHKIKIAGVMLSEEAGHQDGIRNTAAVEYVHDISSRGGAIFEVKNHAL